MIPNIPPEKLNELLKQVSEKLNIPEEKIKKQLELGAFDNALKGLGAQNTKKLQQILQNPALAEQMLNSPQARELLTKLMGGK